eukprot:CAMPEP_0194088288 /NCGR_PEP_ID=MMETSP0149-20130528/28516_1 /TAXON_ID=122233 /ORGANISM="Chaetoceros debilis, Strain MM31A-1" /LENGTH=72 /DNA_ID=CAMNT_0038771903 /DNA_START=969 /DNA_END=1184 /DNA_ORIENTATION=-
MGKIASLFVAIEIDIIDITAVWRHTVITSTTFFIGDAFLPAFFIKGPVLVMAYFEALLSDHATYEEVVVIFL